MGLTIAVIGFKSDGFSTHFYNVQIEELTPLLFSADKNKHI